MSPIAIFLSLSLALLAGASNVHQSVARKSHLNRASHNKQSLNKRDFSGHATYFADGP